MKRTHRIGAVSALGLSLVLTLGACGSPDADDSAGSATQATTGANAQPVAATVQTPDESTITGLFDQWNAALATGDPQQVADRYAPDAVLLPTVSDQERADRAQIVDYFTEFLKKKPSGVITNSTVIPLSPTAAVDTGTYDFTLTVDGEKQLVPARYTFVYELIDGKWLIVNHHSSVEPLD